MVQLLVISKQPEFTPAGEVVPGQCEPYTGNWRLRLVENGSEDTILEGTYYELRRVQRRCIGKTSEDIRELAAEACEAMKTSTGASPEGDANESTQILGMDEVRRAMLEMELTAAVDDFDEKAEWLEVSHRDGVVVASLGAEVESAAAGQVAGALCGAFGSAQSGLVIDLGDREPAGEGFVEALRELAALARDGGRFLAFVGANERLEKALGDGSGEPASLYPDLDSALAAAVQAREELEGAPSSEAPGYKPIEE